MPKESDGRKRVTKPFEQEDVRDNEQVDVDSDLAIVYGSVARGKALPENAGTQNQSVTRRRKSRKRRQSSSFVQKILGGRWLILKTSGLSDAIRQVLRPLARKIDVSQRHAARAGTARKW